MLPSSGNSCPQRRPVHARGVGRHGFTLIEIVVVVVILAIAAAIVVPYVVATDDLEVISAARMVACDLQYAQDVAITSQLPVTVTFDTSGESYELTNASGTLVHPIKKSAYVISFAAQRGFEDLDVSAAAFGGGPTVTFDELGSPDNSGSVTLQAGSHVYQVDVAAATGKVTVNTVGP